MKDIRSIRIGEYADENESTVERVVTLLQDCGAATRAEIVGATGRSWASVTNALNTLIEEGKVSEETQGEPYVFEWLQ